MKPQVWIVLAIGLAGCAQEKPAPSPAPVEAAMDHTAVYGEPPAGWDLLTSTPPGVSMSIPSGWGARDAGPSARGAGQPLIVASASSPPDAKGERMNITIQSLPAIHAAVNSVGLKQFADGQVAAETGIKLIDSKIVDLPVGLAFRLELEVPMSALTERHIVYAILTPMTLFEIQFAEPRADKGLAKIEGPAIKSFKIQA